MESMDHQVLDLAFLGSLHQVLRGLEDQQVKAYPLHQEEVLQLGHHRV